jgi:hypothetical protein
MRIWTWGIFKNPLILLNSIAWVTILLLCILSIRAFFVSHNSPYDNIGKENLPPDSSIILEIDSLSLLKEDSVKTVSVEDYKKRLEFLVNVLLQDKIVEANYSLTRETTKMQIRIAFIAFLALLLFPVIRFKYRYKWIFPTVLLLGASFYAYDIDNSDSVDKQEYKGRMINITLLHITKLPFEDTKYYNIDYTIHRNWWKDAEKRNIMTMLIKPDLVHVAFYLIPMMSLCFAFLMNAPQKRKNMLVKKRKKRYSNYY